MAYEYSGVITSADPSTGVAPGTRFSGMFTYDPAYQPGALMIEGSTGYNFHNSLLGPGVPDTSRLTLYVGANPVFGEGQLNVGVTDTVNYHYTDPFTPSTLIGISSQNSYLRESMTLTLNSPNRSIDPTLALPTSLSLADFPEARIELRTVTNTGSVVLYQGTIDTLTPIPVPEPGMLALPVVLGAGLALRRCRRRRSETQRTS